MRAGAALAAAALVLALGATGCGRAESQTVCDKAYPDTCIFPPPPDLDCRDIAHRQFRVLPPDDHNFDRTGDGLGCTRRDMDLE